MRTNTLSRSGMPSPTSSQEAAETAIRLSKEDGIIWDNLAASAEAQADTGIESPADGCSDENDLIVPAASDRRQRTVTK